MLNDFYLQEDTLAELRKVFDSEGSVVMQQAINEDIALPNSVLEEEALHARWEKADVDFHGVDDFLEKFGIVDVTFEVIRMGWKDYEILVDDAAFSGVEVVIDLTDTWEDSWGGQIRYTDGNEKLLMIPIQKHMMSITKMGELYRYITYCNHHCNGHKRTLLVGRGKLAE